MNDLLAAIQLYLRVCDTQLKSETCEMQDFHGQLAYYRCKVLEIENANQCPDARKRLLYLVEHSK